ncbi:MAG TPA: sigma-70 family RNA polymerase sigma factor [Blastocatellia bacterium]|nr:sigma-70 family RNA polymerase sigma factor [Blastocatellia bacterium]
MQLATDTVEASERDQDLVSLVRAVATGDQSALAALYDATNRLIYSIVLRVLGDMSSSEEVLIDVYTQIWRQAASYDADRGAPLAWMTTIARSRAIDRLRSGWQDQHRKEPLDVLGDAPANGDSPEESAAASERQTLVREALKQLTPEQRQVIELAYYSGLSHSEIAQKLSQPLGTVKTRTRLGMMKLREALAPLLGEN